MHGFNLKMRSHKRYLCIKIKSTKRLLQAVQALEKPQLQKNVSRVARVLYAALETKEKCIRDAFNTEALDSTLVSL